MGSSRGEHRLSIPSQELKQTGRQRGMSLILTLVCRGAEGRGHTSVALVHVRSRSPEVVGGRQEFLLTALQMLGRGKTQKKNSKK